MCHFIRALSVNKDLFIPCYMCPLSSLLLWLHRQLKKWHQGNTVFFFSFNFMGLFQTAVFEANYIVYFMFSLLRRHNHKKHMIKMVEVLPPLQFSRLKTCIFSLFVEGKLFKALKWMSNLSVDLILTNICFLCVSHYLNLCF